MDFSLSPDNKPQGWELPVRNPLRTHAQDSRFETLKNARKIRFSSWPAQVPSKLPRLPRSVLSRAVVNWRGDFPNASLFDRQVNNARGEKAAFGTAKVAPSSRTHVS